jgi:tetratricopeptide (TPR) repeat protein
MLYIAGRYDEALEVLNRAVGTNRTQRDLEAAGRVVAKMGMAHRYLGTLAEGMALVQPMVDLLTPHGPSPALASLHLTLARLAFLVGRYGEVQEHSERAGQIARAIGDERLLGDAEVGRAAAMGELGHWDQSLQIDQQAIPLIERGGDLLALSSALTSAFAACARLGRIEEATQFVERALALAERIGNPVQTAFILANMGRLLTGLGDWTGAREHLERALALLGGARMVNAVNPLGALGELAMREGKWEEAAELLNEALTVSQRTGDRQFLEITQPSLAEFDILSGRPQEAVRRLEDWELAQDVYPSVRSMLAWALLETGAVERAGKVVTKALQSMRAEQNQLELVVALRVYGMVLTRQGETEGATSAFEEGLELARALGFPYPGALILCQMGLLEQQQGNPEKARARLEEALLIFRRLGALKDVEQTEQHVAKLA